MNSAICCSTKQADCIVLFPSRTPRVAGGEVNDSIFGLIGVWMGVCVMGRCVDGCVCDGWGCGWVGVWVCGWVGVWRGVYVDGLVCEWVGVWRGVCVYRCMHIRSIVYS